MYEDRLQKTKEPTKPHIEMAYKIADELSNIEPQLQNEMVQTIIKCLSESREKRMDNLEKEIAYLRDCQKALLPIA